MSKTVKYLEKAQEEAQRICGSLSAGKGGTSWNKVGTVRKTQPWLMGEGSGPNLICFGTDKVTSRGGTPGKEATKKVRKKQDGRKRKTKKQLEVELRSSLKKRAKEGKIPVGFRVYVLPYPKRNWWEIAQQMGGLPSRVDVANTPYGDLIIVPVKEVLLGEGVAPEEPMRDRDGREYWIPHSIMDNLKQIFGPIKWKSPLTFREIDQFGVKLIK
jgi:hypothetical protein